MANSNRNNQYHIPGTPEAGFLSDSSAKEIMEFLTAALNDAQGTSAPVDALSAAPQSPEKIPDLSDLSIQPIVDVGTYLAALRESLGKAA